MEQADVVVVGARLAGCAVAAPLARAGRKVVVLDKMSFPSDQLSTHLLMPAGTSELSQARRAAADPGAEPVAGPLGHARGRGHHAASSACARRPTGSTTASASRATCRTSASSRRRASRAPTSASAARSRRCTGAPDAWRACATPTSTATEHDISATLVVGADGRRSSVAAEVGAWHPYRRLAQRPRPGLPLPRRAPGRGPRDAETFIPVARGRLVRVRLPVGSRRAGC